MEGLKRMTDSIEYIEEHLNEQLDIDYVAAVAFLSKFHYQRLFHMLTGITVSEYIRKRRLTRAAQELVAGEGKIIDLAIKYGYDTPESFSRAFRNIHGISPSQARKEGKSLKAFPKLSFQIQLKGDEELNYKIVKKEGFKVVGKELRTSTKGGENLKKIPVFWEESHENGTVQKLEKHAGDLGVLGICMDFTPELEELSYIIAIEKPEYEPMDGLVEKHVPSATWAVFESVGAMPDAIKNVWQRIFSEWFPSTGYEHAGGPEIEVYPNEDAYSDDYRCEVWIPIMDK
ncbi:AraC family transcriptional regulator [Aquisalibacillus elongatus]|uniref:AraC family transcriptional regulator n=1 Tax=Aquisalibacillus elongatus TaxID=485577 RepID=A0A3N5B977_9BACI|nr:AraC family transcriptional regulator [Aquisalibacillus elongatus]RPF53943.1 AraC family transcriptional regulator [Aquisalibacillus elongatus]